MDFYHYLRGHRYTVVLRDETTVYVDAVDLVNAHEGYSQTSKLRYLVEEGCAWRVLHRPELVVCGMWREAQHHLTQTCIARYAREPDWTPQQQVVFDEIVRLSEAKQEVLAALLHNKTLAALRDRFELIYVDQGTVHLTALGRQLAWLREHPQPRPPTVDHPPIPPG